MRQAIVLIHGIGEPRPMATLRAFVSGILSEEPAPAATVRSKPDRLSESYELRRLVADGTRARPTTDFFEYYWAHHMEGNRIGHVWPLIKLLLMRWPWRVPGNLLVLWFLSWVLIAAAVWIWYGLLTEGTETLQASQPVLWAAASLLLGLLQVVVSGYLGDAARYLSPTPENVSIRQKIRAEGIDVVRRIQDSGKYDRIVIVGHSLGSVIGYDIITHLWDQCNAIHNKPDRPVQDALSKLERVGKTLTQPSSGDLVQFRMLQRGLWKEQLRLGNPWLITDFVTVGSPLTYGAMLFARDREELLRRQSDRELPTCPPVADANRYAYRSPKYYVQGAPRVLKILHHAAPFAVTRWTNIYAPVRAGLLGDWIAGPMQSEFGYGIADVRVTGGLAQYFPLLAHTQYWRPGADTNRLSALREALDLNSREWLPSTTLTDSVQPPTGGDTP
jgi:hypothetical protein